MITKHNDKQACEHKWVHLRCEGTVEIGYRRWAQVDLFYCEKCLEQKRIEAEKPERRTFGGF